MKLVELSLNVPVKYLVNADVFGVAAKVLYNTVHAEGLGWISCSAVNG